jgi:hypothetical protein
MIINKKLDITSAFGMNFIHFMYIYIHINSVAFKCIKYTQMTNIFLYVCYGHFQKGKKLPLNCKDEEGEVTDEDEGSETSKKKEKPRRVLLCKELSDLISLVRCRFVSFLTSKEIRMLIYDTKIQCIACLDSLTIHAYAQVMHVRKENVCNLLHFVI